MLRPTAVVIAMSHQPRSIGPVMHHGTLLRHCNGEPSGPSGIRHLLMLLGSLVLATAVTSAQAQSATVTPASAPRSAAASNAPCETCGTVIAINRVVVEGASPPLAGVPQRVLESATVDGTTLAPSRERNPKQRYEVVVRLSAGTQQVVMLDDAPKIVVGQRVRIIDGAVLPDRG